MNATFTEAENCPLRALIKTNPTGESPNASALTRKWNRENSVYLPKYDVCLSNKMRSRGCSLVVNCARFFFPRV
jgi:hypothetical protein